jgi:prepilin-type N-terminal cleavage/methylation domain-containing protein
MKKYEAFTLLELIIVMTIMTIISWISVLSYRSLMDSFAMNEVSLTIAQDIRSAQRSAMFLDREGNERWLHGIGLDFSRIEDEREYDIFKWCSEFNNYDNSEASLTGELPNYSGGEIDDVKIAEELAMGSDCLRADGGGDDGLLVTETKRFGDYTNLDFKLDGVEYILFESVSGKAFFYDSSRNLLNYEPGDVVILKNNLERFDLRLGPMRKAGLAGRNLKVQPVSGMIFFEFDNDEDD